MSDALGYAHREIVAAGGLMSYGADYRGQFSSSRRLYRHHPQGRQARRPAGRAIAPTEFGAYCRGLKRPDFSIAGLDRCAREKAVAQGREAFTQGGLVAGPGAVGMVHDAS